jgi:hypothetical protein
MVENSQLLIWNRFNSLLKGLQQANITIPNKSKKDFLKDFREHLEIKKILVILFLLNGLLQANSFDNGVEEYNNGLKD